MKKIKFENSNLTWCRQFGVKEKCLNYQDDWTTMADQASSSIWLVSMDSLTFLVTDGLHATGVKVIHNFKIIPAMEMH